MALSVLDVMLGTVHIVNPGYVKEKIIQSNLLTRLGYNEWITRIGFIVPFYITFVEMI